MTLPILLANLGTAIGLVAGTDGTSVGYSLGAFGGLYTTQYKDTTIQGIYDRTGGSTAFEFSLSHIGGFNTIPTKILGQIVINGHVYYTSQAETDQITISGRVYKTFTYRTALGFSLAGLGNGGFYVVEFS